MIIMMDPGRLRLNVQLVDSTENELLRNLMILVNTRGRDPATSTRQILSHYAKQDSPAGTQQSLLIRAGSIRVAQPLRQSSGHTL